MAIRRPCQNLIIPASIHRLGPACRPFTSVVVKAFRGVLPAGVKRALNAYCDFFVELVEQIIRSQYHAVFFVIINEKR